jgi:hypothetical protein
MSFSTRARFAPRLALARRSAPPRVNPWPAATVWLLLDRLGAPGWMVGAAMTVIGLAVALSLLDLLGCREVTLDRVAGVVEDDPPEPL